MQTHMGLFINISRTDDSPTGLGVSVINENRVVLQEQSVGPFFSFHLKAVTSALRVFIRLSVSQTFQQYRHAVS